MISHISRRVAFLEPATAGGLLRKHIICSISIIKLLRTHQLSKPFNTFRMAFLTPFPALTRPSPTTILKSPRRPSRSMPQATIAAPTTPNPPNKPDHAQPETAPWMPLPGVVHELLTPEQYDRLCCVAEENNKLLVIDFMASWCRKCIYLVPKLRKLAKMNQDSYFCTVDVNKVNRLPRQFDIKKMPTFVFVRQRNQVARLVGGASPGKVAKQLEETIEKFANVEHDGSSS